MEHKRNIAEKKCSSLLAAAQQRLEMLLKEKNAADGTAMSLALQGDKDLQCSWSLSLPTMLISEPCPLPRSAQVGCDRSCQILQ